jgi:multisubunit Na+/H+ antiporter MnhG subunit
VIADALGIRAVYYLGGVLLLLAGAIGLARLPPRANPPHHAQPTARDS